MVIRKRCRNARLAQSVHLIIAVSIALGLVLTVGVVESHAGYRGEAEAVGVREVWVDDVAEPMTPADLWVSVVIIGGLALTACLLTLLAEWLMKP
jgi:hypothetical protein